APIDVDRYGVGHIALEVEVSLRNSVGPHQHPDDVADRGVWLTRDNMGAHVAAAMHTEREDFAVAIERHRGSRRVIARLGVADEAFGARGAPAYCAAKLVGRMGARDVFRISGRACAEAAADIAGRHPHAVE